MSATSRETDALDGPVVQSIAIGFRALFAAIGVLTLAWLASNWREVPVDSQAVVLLLGRITGVRQSGLTLSWPRPVGAVALAPGAARLLTLKTASTARTGGLVDIYTQASGAALQEGSGDYLTGDGGVVLLGATLTFQVSDGAAYYLAQAHVAPALQRLFAASAVSVVAARALDDVMVARPERADSDPARAARAETRRQALRGDLVAEVNRRLAELAVRGAALGVSVTRIDLDAALPPAAKLAYDGVLVAVQLAEQAIAGARTEATRIAQEGTRERDRLLTAARANAEERVGEARARTAAILAVRAAMLPATRATVLEDVYRDQLAAVLHRVGRVTAVDTSGGARIMLPATMPVGSAQ